MLSKVISNSVWHWGIRCFLIESQLDCSGPTVSTTQAQHISSGVHGSAGANVPTQHPRHQTAVSALCHRTVVQCGHRRRGPREQHPPHPLHHPHSALCSQHVCFTPHSYTSPRCFCCQLHARNSESHFKICLFSTRATSREEKNLQSFQEQPSDKWVESSYEVEGPHYFTILAMHILPPEQWRSSRVYFLRRLLLAAHARKVSAVSTNKYDTLPCIGPVFFFGLFFMMWSCIRLTVRQSCVLFHFTMFTQA